MNAERMNGLKLGLVVSADADDGGVTSAVQRVLDRSFDCSGAYAIRDQIASAPTSFEATRQL
jgi:hypothetical protein